MKHMDLTAEVTALRDKAIQPRELGRLFSMVDGMPEEFKQLFLQCDTYNKIYDVLNALEDHGFVRLDYVK